MCSDAPNVNLNIIELDHLITVEKLEEDMQIKDILNSKSKFETPCLGDP